MASSLTSEPARSSADWREAFRREGYYLRQAAILTILMGVYLHVTRAFLGGDELLRQYVYTPTYDRVLTFPMAYAALTGVLARKQIAFRSRGQRIGYWLAWFYIAASVPLHIVTGYVRGSTKFIEAFPLWYSYLLLPVYAAIIWLYWRLPLRRDDA